MEDTPWLDREAYPFTSHYFDIEGNRLHYVDEGEGRPIVLVHGTATWSFVYRNLIKDLSPHYRCVSVDHLGYGLSGKPLGAPYGPQDHAQRLQALIEHLDLRDITLVVHDFGGPIGLSYALDHPENIHSLAIFNTWMWSLRNEPLVQAASLSSRGLLGRLFIQKLNLELHGLFKVAFGDLSKLTPEIHRHYLDPVPTPEDREAMRVLAEALIGSSDWYDELWSQRERIQDIPALLMWGMKDPIFRPRHLERWQGVFSRVETVRFPGVGHFVQEEVDGLGERVLGWLGGDWV